MNKPVWKSIVNIIILVSGIIYLFALYYFTIGKTPAVIINGHRYLSYNLIPLKTIIGYLKHIVQETVTKRAAILNLTGNLVLVLPLALYLAYFFKPLRKLRKILLTSLFVICLIELIQLFTGRGSFDIDDIILNAIGASIGYGIFNMRPVKRVVEHIQFDSDLPWSKV